MLKVISSSPGELEPVFQAMLANATRICEAKFGICTCYDGDDFPRRSSMASPPAFAESCERDPIRPARTRRLGASCRDQAGRPHSTTCEPSRPTSNAIRAWPVDWPAYARS